MIIQKNNMEENPKSFKKIHFEGKYSSTKHMFDLMVGLIETNFKTREP